MQLVQDRASSLQVAAGISRAESNMVSVRRTQAGSSARSLT